jgi:hypothetical protein
MTVEHEKVNSGLVCADCGRQLAVKDEERTWAKCRFCGKPVCFDCIRYVGTTVRGPYMHYVEAIRTCSNCYVPRG